VCGPGWTPVQVAQGFHIVDLRSVECSKKKCIFSLSHCFLMYTCRLSINNWIYTIYVNWKLEISPGYWFIEAAPTNNSSCAAETNGRGTGALML